MNIHTFHWQELITLWEHGPMLNLTATGLWAVCFYILVSSFQNPWFKWCAAQGGSTPQRELDLLGFSPQTQGYHLGWPLCPEMKARETQPLPSSLFLLFLPHFGFGPFIPSGRAHSGPSLREGGQEGTVGGQMAWSHPASSPSCTSLTLTSKGSVAEGFYNFEFLQF